MKNIDFDRAFPATPESVHAAIELGIHRGRRQMQRHRHTFAAIGAAAAVLVMALISIWGVRHEPQPDVLAQPPFTEKVAIPDFTVYITDAGRFYHTDPACSGMENARAISEAEALKLDKQPCPSCIPTGCDGHEGDEIEFIYYSEGSLYFHKLQNCGDGMYPLKAAYFTLLREVPGKSACPDCLPRGVQACIHGYLTEPPAQAPVPSGAPAASPESQAQTNSKKKGASSGKSSGKTTVYYTESGHFFHSDEHCGGMQNAFAHSREDAVFTGKIGCPLCLQVYCTEKGSFYHLYPDCIGMQGASLCSVEEARNMPVPKTRCATCLNPAKVYATEMGRYCHVEQNCSGMEGAEAMPLDIAIVEKEKQLCPVCITAKFSIPDLANVSVYYSPSETHYHSDTTCAMNSKAGDRHSVQEARAAGKLPCSCAAVYYSRDGGYYHVLPDCMGGGYALVGNIQEATAAGNSRCTICMSPETVYATKTGHYFHARRYCSGMQNASASTPEAEWQNGKTPCPACITTDPQNIYVGGDRTDYNLHYTLFDTAFGNLEQAAAACYGFMEKADGSWRLTNGSQTVCVSRLFGFKNENHPEAKWALEVVPADPDNPDNTPEISSTFMRNVKAMPMMLLYSSAVNAMKNHLANAHPGNEEALFSHVETIDVFFDESLEICACEMVFPCAMHSVNVQITLEESTADDRSWRVNTQLYTSDSVTAQAAIPEITAINALPENYDLFTIAFGQGIENLKPGYTYDHSSDFSWVISNGDENYNIAVCDVYPEGTAFFGEALPCLPELHLHDLSSDPAPVHMFMKTASEPISSMYSSAQAEVEKLARTDAAEEFPLDAVSVYFDANRRVRKCEMQFGSGFMDHVKLAWEVKNDGQIELAQSEFIKSKWV